MGYNSSLPGSVKIGPSIPKPGNIPLTSHPPPPPNSSLSLSLTPFGSHHPSPVVACRPESPLLTLGEARGLGKKGEGVSMPARPSLLDCSLLTAQLSETIGVILRTDDIKDYCLIVLFLQISDLNTYS